MLISAFIGVCPGLTGSGAGTTLLLSQNKVYELTAGLSEYENISQIKGQFTSVGGGTPTILVNRLATEFSKIYPDVVLSCRSGGGVGGFSDLLEGKIDLVPFARPLHADEISAFRDHFGYEPAQIIVAQDSIAIYVNRRNPISGLTLTQLDAIYSRNSKRGGGRPESWNELGVGAPLGDKLIKKICLSRVYGTCQFFQEFVMLGEDYRFSVQFEPVNSSMVQAVGVDDEAIGFASVMFASDRTRFVPLQAEDGQYLMPSYENTLSGKYPLIRPMRIIFNRKPDGSMGPAAREFLRFAVSRRGQRIIGLAGSYPITPEQQQQALKTIGEVQRVTQ